jgi:tRNA dimethylallyltransferase
MAPSLPVIAIAGPTGSGKSELALVLAQAFAGEIVNYDSVQVYRGFDIGSAKIPDSERRGIHHHLIDIRDPDDVFTAGDFAEEALRSLQEIASRNHVPILCGGTGFYLRALLRGVSDAPARDASLREDLNRRERRRPGAVHRLLRRLDPAAGGRIHPNDLNKSIRALEIRLLAGRSSESLFREHPPLPAAALTPLILGLDPPRDLLYQRLSQRCEHMWRGGLLDEVRRLLAQGVDRTAKPFESLGYKQALQFLSGEREETEALEEMKIRTRQYAKRQWTWFRAEPGIEWLRGFGGDGTVQHEAVALITAFLKKIE